MVLTLSSSEKLIVGWFSTLALFGSSFEPSVGNWATDITLEGWEPVPSRAVKMTLIVPKGGLEEEFPWTLNPTWFPCPLGRYKNYCNLPFLTNYSKWFHRVLQSSVVCSRSWWYWQWRLWLRLMGSPPILFGHLKYGSFLIFSKTWCTSSRNTVLTIWGAVGLYWPVKSFRGLLLLYRSNLKSLLSWGTILAFPFPCYCSSLTLLYLSIWSMSWCTLVAGFPVKDFLKPYSAGKLTLKVLIDTSSKSPSISLNISQYLFEYVFKVFPFHMAIDSRESKGRGTLLHVMKWDPKD